MGFPNSMSKNSSCEFFNRGSTDDTHIRTYPTSITSTMQTMLSLSIGGGADTGAKTQLSFLRRRYTLGGLHLLLTRFPRDVC